MKRSIGLICALILCLAMPLAAMAQGEIGTDVLTATGSIIGANERAIKAPVSGELNEFTWRAGEAAEAGELLFSVATEKLYADYDGTVNGIFAAPGDDAAAVSARYGALLYIEPADSFVIRTSTANAYDEEENKYLHVGTHVYIKSRSSSKYTGEGRIISISGVNYTVEVTEGDLRFDEDVEIFLKSAYESKDRIGKGTVTRLDPIAVNASGTVVKLYVREGQAVQKGDLLMEYVTDALAPNEANSAEITAVRADQPMILSSVTATQGARVSKGQVLAIAYPRGSMQLAVDIDERLISTIAVGGGVEIEFENLQTARVKGTIASISYINKANIEDCKYTVYIDFTPGDEVRLGMRATAYFER